METLSSGSLLHLIEESQKPYVLVNFYTTNCKPCLEELPGLIALHQDSASQVQVVFIALGNTPISELSAFNQQNGMDFATYRFESPDSAGVFIRRNYPEWDDSVPLNLVYASAPPRFIAQTGMTDRTEVEMILGQDQMMLR